MSLQAKEVLIIDDSPDVRMRCRKILENLGMVVSEAESVREALALLSKKLPHLIILDMRMPGESGFDFLISRKSLPDLAAVPVIVSSGLGEKDSVYKAISLGANDYVLKPLNASLISQRIRKHVRGLEFKRFRFPEKDTPSVALHIGAQITKLQETNFTLESQIRIAKNTRLTLSPSTIKTLDVSACVLITKTESVRGISGSYVTQVNVAGLDETIQKKIGKYKA